MSAVAAVEQSEPDARSRLWLWSGLTQADTGAAVRVPPAYSDKTAMAQGTFGGGSYSLECSMDGVNFAPALDAQGSAIAFTAAAALVVGTDARYWRIANDGMGTAETVSIYLLCTLG